MERHPAPAPRVLNYAVALGLLGDHLIRGEPWGVNVTLGLWAVIGTAVALAWARNPGTGERQATWPWLAAAYFASTWTIRDAEVLLGANLLAALALSALPLVPVAALGAAGLIETAMAPARAAWHAVLGMLRLAPAMQPWALETPGATRAKSMALGLLLALPAVVLFGALFAAADPVFGRAVSSLNSLDLESLGEHVMLTGALTWGMGGYLWALASPPRLYRIPHVRPGLTSLAVLTGLGTVALVFVAFVATQAGSLFGGETFIREQTGLTYAEYARQGFFQMIVASALSLPLVYAAPFAIGDSPGESHHAVSLKSLMAVQLALTALVLASALWRMGLYVRAYGLTEDRVYGTAVMLWIGTTIGVFARTVLRGQPAKAAFGSVVAAVTLLAALNLANPQAFIARYNLDRPGARGVDVEHLAHLGSDAAPLLVAHLDLVDAASRCTLAKELVRRYGTARGDWRGWNLARAAARRAVLPLAAVVRSCPEAPIGTS